MNKKNKKQVNYRRLFAIQKNIGETLKKACPDISTNSGIYFYIREDFKGKHAYIGKASNLLERNISHLQGYQQRIDVSLKKRGFYSPDNLGGWKLNVLCFPKNQLDKAEQYYIDLYKRNGYDLYNIESGGNLGKTDINERKLGKGYYDGIAQGKKKLKEELNYIIDKYLVITLKKENKLSQKALEKFNRLLGEEDNNEEESGE